MADNKDTQDWVADCDGEGRERAVRDSRDSGVVMMAVAVEDGSSGRQWQRQKRIAAKDNCRVKGWELETGCVEEDNS